MTTVYKPLGLNFLAKTSERMLFPRQEVRKVKRVLFGPVDHTETQKFLEEELEKITVEQSETWNFDFKREQMLNPDGRYIWRPVTPHKTIRPIKKFPVVEIDTHEFYGQPNEIIRPIPIKVIKENADVSSTPKSQTQKSKPQRLITGKYTQIFLAVNSASNDTVLVLRSRFRYLDYGFYFYTNVFQISRINTMLATS